MGAGRSRGWRFLSSQTFCEWRCCGESGPWPPEQVSTAGQMAPGAPRKVKIVVALSQSRELFRLTGLPGQHCDVTGRGGSRTDTCPGAVGESGVLLPVPGTVSCLLSGTQPSSFLLLSQHRHNPARTETVSVDPPKSPSSASFLFLVFKAAAAGWRRWGDCCYPSACRGH